MRVLLSIIMALWLSSGLAETLNKYQIPMQSQGSKTLYVQSTIQGYGQSMLLVDTGSGHSVINEKTLSSLKSSGDAKFLRNLQGIMADGRARIIPLYRIASITIGDKCIFRNIEAAVLPNNSRQILGISTLQKAAPFGMSFNPPVLSLSNCESSAVKTASEESNFEAPTIIPVNSEQKSLIQDKAVAVAG